MSFAQIQLISVILAEIIFIIVPFWRYSEGNGGTLCQNYRYSYGIPVFCILFRPYMLQPFPVPALAGAGVVLHHHDHQHTCL